MTLRQVEDLVRAVLNAPFSNTQIQVKFTLHAKFGYIIQHFWDGRAGCPMILRLRTATSYYQILPDYLQSNYGVRAFSKYLMDFGIYDKIRAAICDATSWEEVKMICTLNGYLKE